MIVRGRLLLLLDRHELTVFEANAYPGGHTNTVRVDTATATQKDAPIEGNFRVIETEARPFASAADAPGIGNTR